MRILHLCSYPLFSGPLPPTLGLARAQAALGHRVHVACDAKRGHLPAFEEAALPYLGELADPHGLTLSTKSSVRELLRDALALRGLTRSGAIDVLHAHQSHDHGLLAVAAAGPVRRVRTVHAARMLEHGLACRLWARGTDAWLVRAPTHAARLQARLGPRYAGRVHLVPGSIDAARFTPAPAAARARARQRLGLPAAATLVGHVALLAGRGQEELVAALVRTPAAVHVALVGRGPHEAALRRAVAAAGLQARVHFLGYCRAAALGDAYAAMDAAFLAQAGNDAGVRAALEALACGLPLLAPRQDALAPLLDAAGGLEVAHRTPAAIAATLAALHALPPAARDALGQRGRAYVLAERGFAREAAATLALYAAPPGGQRWLAPA